MHACLAQLPRIVPATPRRAVLPGVLPNVLPNVLPGALDAHIGRQVAFLRALYQASAAELAERVGCTVEQVERFEAAAERIGADRLLELARVFNVQVRFFFDGFRQADGAMRLPRGLFADALLAA